jgi:hypothetical protein
VSHDVVAVARLLHLLQAPSPLITPSPSYRVRPFDAVAAVCAPSPATATAAASVGERSREAGASSQGCHDSGRAEAGAPAARASQAVVPALGRRAPAESTQAAPPTPLPHDAPRTLAPRAVTSNSAARDVWLKGLQPYFAPDGLSSADYRTAVARGGLGFELQRRASRIAHPDAGKGVWLKGKASIGALVAIYPGVVYAQVYHGCYPLCFLLPLVAVRRQVHIQNVFSTNEKHYFWCLPGHAASCSLDWSPVGSLELLGLRPISVALLVRKPGLQHVQQQAKGAGRRQLEYSSFVRLLLYTWHPTNCRVWGPCLHESVASRLRSIGGRPRFVCGSGQPACKGHADHFLR